MEENAGTQTLLLPLPLPLSLLPPLSSFLLLFPLSSRQVCVCVCLDFRKCVVSHDMRRCLMFTSMSSFKCSAYLAESVCGRIANLTLLSGVWVFKLFCVSRLSKRPVVSHDTRRFCFSASRISLKCSAYLAKPVCGWKLWSLSNMLCVHGDRNKRRKNNRSWSSTADCFGCMRV